MKSSFWIKRFVVVWLSAFLILFVVGLLKRRSLEQAATESAVWGSVTALVFVAAQIYQSRKGQHCALCRDTPEMGGDGQPVASIEDQRRK